MTRRLQFYWWGSFWRGWLQWGPIHMCADKNWDVTGRGWLFGPIQITWWCRHDWERYCYTEEEAAEEDRKDRLSESEPE